MASRLGVASADLDRRPGSERTLVLANPFSFLCGSYTAVQLGKPIPTGADFTAVHSTAPDRPLPWVYSHRSPSMAPLLTVPCRGCTHAGHRPWRRSGPSLLSMMSLLVVLPPAEAPLQFIVHLLLVLPLLLLQLLAVLPPEVVALLMLPVDRLLQFLPPLLLLLLLLPLQFAVHFLLMCSLLLFHLLVVPLLELESLLALSLYHLLKLLTPLLLLLRLMFFGS